MKDSLQKRCNDFIASRDVLKRTFRMEHSALYPVCANIFAARGQVANADKLLRCRDILKNNTGIFSNFRGTVRLPVLSMLSISPLPEEKTAQMLEYYRLLKEHFFTSEYLALVAMLLSGLSLPHPAEEVVARGREIYSMMNKEHPFLTSSEDSVFAVLLALSEKDDYALIADMEDCYDRLKAHFSSGNSVQASSHVLALAEGSTLEKSARVIALFDGIRNAGGKYGKQQELAVLAALDALPVEIGPAVQDLMEVDAFLAGQKGYSLWSVDRRTRMMHAAMILSSEYSPHTAPEAAMLGSTMAIIAAQQAAMCTVITCTASSSASH